MKENRLTERLSGYWMSLRKNQEMPPFETFNKEALNDLWDYCMLIAVNDNETGEQRYNYYKMGKEAQALQKSGSIAMVQRVGKVVDSHKPLYDSGQYINADSHLVKYRSCALPFGHDGHVTHVIVGMSRKELG